jgi:hypothetical protein
MAREVTFEPVDGPIHDLIDEAYREKYRNSPYLSPMISTRARAAKCRPFRSISKKPKKVGLRGPFGSATTTMKLRAT